MIESPLDAVSSAVPEKGVMNVGMGDYVSVTCAESFITARLMPVMSA